MSLPAPYYDDGAGITLFHADCREILPHLPPVDLVLTDPPYGIGEARKNFGSRSNLARADLYVPAAWDDEPPTAETMRSVVAAGRLAIVFGGNYFGFPAASKWLVWDKDRTGDFADCELAWTNLGGAVRRLRFRWNGMLQEHGGRHKEARFHPTQKPVPVMRWCIEQAGDGVETILDPFAGSGTALVAARDLGRKCIGVEIEERYAEIAANRLRQGVLFR